MSDVRCILPWSHLATTPSGSLRLCCNSTPGENMPRGEGGRPYRIYNETDLAAFWNGPFMKGVRLDMLSGREPDVCSRCFKEERAGIKSARQSWNEFGEKHILPYLDDLTGSDGSAPLRFEYVDLRLGNLCNLKCRMCGPYSSSMWVDEWSLVASPLTEEEARRLERMDWSEDARFVDALEPHFGSIEMIYLTGGEPTLAKSQTELLDRLIATGHAENIRLKYNTNATNINRKLVDRWSSFKTVILNLSIDAVGELNRYIRFPADWQTIDKNLRIIDALCGEKGWEASIHTTVQVYNVLRLGDLMAYARTFNHIDVDPHLNILDHPDWLNIQTLPQALKLKASERLLAMIDADISASLADRLRGVNTYMFGQDRSHLWPEFLRKTSALDARRQQLLIEILPELYED